MPVEKVKGNLSKYKQELKREQRRQKKLKRVILSNKVSIWTAEVRKR